MPDRPGLLSSIASTVRRIVGPEPGASAVAQVMDPQASAVRQDAAPGGVARVDCGVGGCQPPPGWGSGGGGGGAGLYALMTEGRFAVPGGLDRSTIDLAYTETLMRTIVERIVDDANRDRPTLSGEYVGELSDVVPWLAARGWFEEDAKAQVLSRKDGGAAVLCFVDDGRPPEMEVDLASIRDVRGFVALSKYECRPADLGSTRPQVGWYGPRAGRPEHYEITPDAGTLETLSAVAGSGAAQDVAQAARTGRRWHRSRLVPRPYLDKLQARAARSVSMWGGWGPGAIEGCLSAYLLYREGGLHTSAILRGSHFNVLSMRDVVHAQSTPTGGAGIRNAMAWIRECLGISSDSLPLIVKDLEARLEAISHNLSGVPQTVAQQRRFLLDFMPEYVEVVLFGSSSGGLSGDSKEGEWRAYYGNVDAERRGRVWTAGAFGGGLRQACLLAMACPEGPTQGQMDPTVQAHWPTLWTESADETASARLKNAQARALDRASLGLTPAAFLRLDPTVQADLPELDIDELPFPELTPGGGALAPPASGAGAAGAGVLTGEPAPTATTPAGALAALAEQQAAPALLEPVADPAGAGGAAPAAGLPADITTQNVLAKALMMTPKAFARWVAEHPEVTPYPMPKGTRGGTRYRMSEVLAAFNASAQKRADALRRR